MAAGNIYHIVYHRLVSMLDGWSQRYGVPHRMKVRKNCTVRVTFDDDQSYALFALTWNPSDERQWRTYFADYRLIEPMKNLY